MNYATIKNYDIANGLGVRVSLFVSGCDHRCKGCFNYEAWDYNYGAPFTKEVEDEIIEMLRPSYIRGLSLLGGEPFEIPNQKGLLPFIKRVREELPNKDIWCYTGFIYDRDLLKPSRAFYEGTHELLSYIDVLVDGPFIEELKDISLRFKGSSNQRIIDVQKSLLENRVVLFEFK